MREGVSMKKVGIFGGTFNPIHTAHLLLAETAREMAGLDEVLFIPSGCSYLKNPKEILPAKDRIRMIELAIEDNPVFKLSEIEVKREGNSYTCDTILELKEQYPENLYYLIVGADSLYMIEDWKAPVIIFRESEILAAVRGEVQKKDIIEKSRELKEKFGAKITLLPMKHVEISSSVIRQNIAEEKSVRYMLPEKVREYILKHHLYENKE